MNRTMTYFDLLDAFGEDGCPVCRLALAAIDHYIDSVNYEFVNDSGFRDEVRAANGFCTEHAYQWLKGANVLGTAIIYTDVLVHLTEELRRIHHPKPTFLRGMVSLLNHRGEQGGEPDDPCDSLVPDGGCPACRVRAEQELRAIATLLEVVGERAVQHAAGARGLGGVPCR